MNHYTEEEIKSITKIISNNPNNLAEGFVKAGATHNRSFNAISQLYYSTIKPKVRVFSVKNEFTGKETINIKNKITMREKPSMKLDTKFRFILNKLDKKTLVDIIMQEN